MKKLVILPAALAFLISLTASPARAGGGDGDLAKAVILGTGAVVLGAAVLDSLDDGDGGRRGAVSARIVTVHHKSPGHHRKWRHHRHGRHRGYPGSGYWKIERVWRPFGCEIRGGHGYRGHRHGGRHHYHGEGRKGGRHGHGYRHGGRHRTGHGQWVERRVWISY